jgi:hypothetical protein
MKVVKRHPWIGDVKNAGRVEYKARRPINTPLGDPTTAYPTRTKVHCTVVRGDGEYTRHGCSRPFGAVTCRYVLVNR